MALDPLLPGDLHPEEEGSLSRERGSLSMGDLCPEGKFVQGGNSLSGGSLSRRTPPYGK